MPPGQQWGREDIPGTEALWNTSGVAAQPVPSWSAVDRAPLWTDWPRHRNGAVLHAAWGTKCGPAPPQQ